VMVNLLFLDYHRTSSELHSESPFRRIFHSILNYPLTLTPTFQFEIFSFFSTLISHVELTHQQLFFSRDELHTEGVTHSPMN